MRYHGKKHVEMGRLMDIGNVDLIIGLVEGKIFPGNQFFSERILCFPVDFPFNQSNDVAKGYHKKNHLK